MRRYDFLCRMPVRLWFRAQVPNACSAVRSRSAEAAGEPGRVASSDQSDSCAGSYTGSLRFLENPSNISAMVSDPGRSDTTSPWRSRRCCPHSQPHEGTNEHDFGTQCHGFNTRCLRFTKHVTVPNARLASGWWLASTGRESNPLDFNERFQNFTSFSFPRLSLTQAGRTHDASSSICMTRARRR
jgi:hypothetical protein